MLQLSKQQIKEIAKVTGVQKQKVKSLLYDLIEMGIVRIVNDQVEVYDGTRWQKVRL